jgi:hypothetical protein
MTLLTLVATGRAGFESSIPEQAALSRAPRDIRVAVAEVWYDMSVFSSIQSS